MDPEADYPAAHSMDTGWFAVDGDGHVAYFYSGEAGAVPEDACREDDSAMLHELESVVPHTEPIYEFRGRFGITDDRSYPRHLFAEAEEPNIVQDWWQVATGFEPAFGIASREPVSGYIRRTVLMFLTSLDAVGEEIERGLAVPVASRDSAAVVFTKLDVETYRRLHDSGACLCCSRNDPTWDDLPERLGFYHFDHPDDLYIPEPYTRRGSPRQPIHVEQLPERFRAKIQQTRFDRLDFEEILLIQPLEHIHCLTWRAVAYLDAEGLSIRPVPGAEDRYRKEHRQISETVGLPAEPPPELPEPPFDPLADEG